jgi:hypothetical protein
MSLPNPAEVDLVQPEYTGENRCLPCTAVNLVLTAVISGAVALVSPPVAAVVAGLSVLSIYYRGYLVPGTPTLTKRYLPERVLAWFGKDGPDQQVTVEEIDTEALLLDAGVLEPAGEDYALVESFQAEWQELAGSVAADERRRSELLDDLLDSAEFGPVTPEDVTTTDGGQSFTVRVDDQPIGRWESREAYCADLAAGRLVESAVEEWPALSFDQRLMVLSGLRLWLEQCPTCDSGLGFGEETVESCCREYEVIAVTCTGCGSRLFEVNAAAL